MSPLIATSHIELLACTYILTAYLLVTWELFNHDDIFLKYEGSFYLSFVFGHHHSACARVWCLTVQLTCESASLRLCTVFMMVVIEFTPFDVLK